LLYAGGTFALTDPTEIDLDTTAGLVTVNGSVSVTAPVVQAYGGRGASAITASGDVNIDASQQFLLGNNDFTGITAGGNLTVNGGGSAGNVTMRTGGLFSGHSIGVNATNLDASSDSEFIAGTTLTAGIGGNLSLSGGYYGGSFMMAGGDVYLKFLGAGSTLSLSGNGGLPTALYYNYSFIESGLPSTVHISFANRSSGGIFIDGAATTTTTRGYSGFYARGVPASQGAGLDLAYAAVASPTVTQANNAVLSAITSSTSNTPSNTSSSPASTPLPPATTGTNGLNSPGSQTVGGGSGQFGGTESGTSGGSEPAATTSGSGGGNSDSSASDGGKSGGNDKDKKSADSGSGNKEDKPSGSKKPVGKCNA
jgi:hypothetical protein